MKRFVLAIHVDNKYGALTRVAGLFMRKGFNIDTANACETTDKNYSIITITLYGDEFVRSHLVNQLKKQHNVKKVVIFDNEETTYERTLLMLKIANMANNHRKLIDLSAKYHLEIIDTTENELYVQVTDTPSKVKEFLKLIRPMGIIDMCQTGVVALSQDENITDF